MVAKNKKMNLSGIYIIENKINKKVYVGSTNNFNIRSIHHRHELKYKKHYNKYLQRAWNKYGENNFIFKLIELCDQENLIIKELYYIQKYDSLNYRKGYNAVSPKYGNNTRENWSIKLSNIHKNLNKNYKRFSLTNIVTKEEFIFDNLVSASKYLLKNNFTKAKEPNIRSRLSICLRGVNKFKDKDRITFNHECKILE